MSDLWKLVWGKPEVDPTDLAAAIAREAGQDRLDFRTRLLIRDGTEALRQHWGEERLAMWVQTAPTRHRIEAIRRENLGEPGFPSLKERLMEKTDPQTVEHFLRDLGGHVRNPVRLLVGGSIALIMPGYLARATEDIDVVDEVPAEVRSLRPLLEQLKKRYGLQLTHFQSHYLPSGWENRLHSVGTFGKLQVYLVDWYDVFLSKLFSKREKDLDDLRILLTGIDKEVLVRRLRHAGGDLVKDSSLQPAADNNWYVLFGEPLPVQPPQQPL
jgi:hypothetical protein